MREVSSGAPQSRFTNLAWKTGLPPADTGSGHNKPVCTKGSADDRGLRETIAIEPTEPCGPDAD